MRLTSVIVAVTLRCAAVACVAALASAPALLAAASASAAVPVDGFVDVFHGSKAPAGYSNTASCDTVECSVSVAIGKRDFNSLTHTSCGTMPGFPTFDVTVANPDSGVLVSNTITCTSPRYSLQVFGQYRGSGSSPVLIHVTVTP